MFQKKIKATKKEQKTPPKKQNKTKPQTKTIC